MKYLILFFLLCFSFCFLGCTAKENSATASMPIKGELPFPLPATFTGEIPCPDCLKVEITLNLRPDAIYQLRKTYRMEQGPPKVESQLGLWRFAENGNFVILGKEKGTLKSYAITDKDRLKFVGQESVADESQIEYDLLREPEFKPFSDSVKLRGMLSYGAGNAVMAECESGQSFAVTGDAEYRRLVQTYLNTPHGHEEPLLVSMEGKLEDTAEGNEQIVVERFKRFYPNRDCDGNPTRANFTDTFWRLIELDGEKVQLKMEEQRLFFLLDSKEKILKGFGVCNSISGTYLVKGEVFLIKRLHTTRMACPGRVHIEATFLRALDDTETYQVIGDLLLLYDKAGKIRAVLRTEI